MNPDDPTADATLGHPGEFDWESPRWRETEEPSDAQRGRRFRGDLAPRQRGAIDEGNSVPGTSDRASNDASGSPDDP